MFLWQNRCNKKEWAAHYKRREKDRQRSSGRYNVKDREIKQKKSNDSNERINNIQNEIKETETKLIEVKRLTEMQRDWKTEKCWRREGRELCKVR